MADQEERTRNTNTLYNVYPNTRSIPKSPASGANFIIDKFGWNSTEAMSDMCSSWARNVIDISWRFTSPFHLFWTILFDHAVPPQFTINGDYDNIIRTRLRNAICSEHPELVEEKSAFCKTMLALTRKRSPSRNGILGSGDSSTIFAESFPMWFFVFLDSKRICHNKFEDAKGINPAFRNNLQQQEPVSSIRYPWTCILLVEMIELNGDYVE